MSDEIVIVGGGLAAQRAAEGLRRLGYARPIRMVCAESHLPYDRPPLSKGVLAGEFTDESLGFRSEAWYEGDAVDLLIDVRTTDLSTEERRVGLSDGTTLRYDQLLIATGSHPRALPMLMGYENVSELRTTDDAQRLRRALGPGMRGQIDLDVGECAPTPRPGRGARRTWPPGPPDRARLRRVGAPLVPQNLTLQDNPSRGA